jgi:CheY-like chemotaxis protein
MMPPENKQYRIPEHAKILVVEDEVIVALDVEMMLVEGGAAEVLVASSLKAASIELMRRTDINLILTDVHLRDGSGLDLVSVARSRNIPIILTTGYDHKKTLGLPQIDKPYVRDELLRIVTEVLQNHIWQE